MTGEMSIVVVAATEMELSNCQKHAGIHYVVSGVGPAMTSMAVCEAVAKYSPDLLIQVGIAGGVSQELALGQVVQVIEDRFGDLGAWRGDHFVSFDNSVYCGEKLDCSLRSVRGVTVSVACNPLIDRGVSEVESMEGASFFMAAAHCGVAAVQIRAISNYMDTPRAEWRVGEAVAALGGALDEVIGTLSREQ